jgi:hypothetical protein
MVREQERRKRRKRDPQRHHEREQKRRQLQREALEAGHIVVYPFGEWCLMRGISIASGRRLIAADRVKVTQLSERRIGIRSDHDLEYLNSCARDFA